MCYRPGEISRAVRRRPKPEERSWASQAGSGEDREGAGSEGDAEGGIEGAQCYDTD